MRRTPAPTPAPESNESDGNAALMAGAVSDAGDGGGTSTEVEVNQADDASPLMDAAVAQESDTAGAFLQQGANDTEDHNAVSTMMDDQNSTDSSLVAFDSQADEEELDMDTGERPSRQPPGVALAGLIRRIRSKTEPEAKAEPAPEPEPQGDPDADADFDGDGVRNADDEDYEPPPAPEDTPETPARRELDLSDIPPASGSPELADIGQESRVSSREMVDPRYRSSAAKNDLSLPTGESPYRRRGGRGKAARRERLRFNQGTGRTPR